MKSALRDKSYSFAIDIVKCCQTVQQTHREFVLSKQLLRSGTSVGALIREAEFGQSREDFSSKMSIALKEANETKYWLNLLYDTGYIDIDSFESLLNQCNELIAMLVATIRTVKRSSS